MERRRARVSRPGSRHRAPETGARGAPWILVMLAVLLAPCLAQSSPNFTLAEHVLNAGGRPDGGTIATSASFRMTLDAIGDPIAAQGAASASFRLSSGLAPAYPPPGEVRGVRFDDKQSLHWEPEPAAGVYHLYRGLLSALGALGYGSCHQQDLMSTQTIDADPVPGGDGYFYLVTVENSLQEEGTKGFDSDNTERSGMSCP